MPVPVPFGCGVHSKAMKGKPTTRHAGYHIGLALALGCLLASGLGIGPGLHLPAATLSRPLIWQAGRQAGERNEQ